MDDGLAAHHHGDILDDCGYYSHIFRDGVISER